MTDCWKGSSLIRWRRRLPRPSRVGTSYHLSGNTSGAQIYSAGVLANLLLSDFDCAEFLKMILEKGGYRPNLDSFRTNLNALTIIPDPKGEVPSTQFVAHVHGYGVSDIVHVDQPGSSEHNMKHRTSSVRSSSTWLNPQGSGR
jgi:hypothetical protein